MHRILFLLFFVIVSSVHGQSEALAKNYFEQGAYEKALALFERLYHKNPGRYDYFIFIVQSNQQLERFSESEKLLMEKLNQCG